LKILHLSNESLPDWRIEKYAITALNLGHELVFAGLKPVNYDRDTFSKLYEVNWTSKARYGIPNYWYTVKKQLNNILQETRPDLVHAHNLFSARMMLEFDLPFVYDDHEYWSKQSQFLLEMEKLNKNKKTPLNRLPVDLLRQTKTRIVNYHVIRLWSKWEREIVSSVPTITVSDEIANGLKLVGNNEKVFVVPNFPMRNEIDGFEKPKFLDKLSSVYAGSDGHNKKKYPNRNIEGLFDIFDQHDIGKLMIIGWTGKSNEKIRYSGYLDRQDMFREMSNHSVGLVPWRNHWSHGYTSPNKAYEYAHAGLLVMCTDSFSTIRATLKENCVTFENYDDMVSKLLYFKDNMGELYQKRMNIFEFARQNLLWENFERRIMDIYKMC
jgi:glycosyltransferase involved in cell wall biosynthesis